MGRGLNRQDAKSAKVLVILGTTKDTEITEGFFGHHESCELDEWEVGDGGTAKTRRR